MANHGDTQGDTYFELERDRLIGNVAENLGKLISSVNQLNRRIEGTVSVGGQFESVSRLWKEYQRVMEASGDERIATDLQTVDIAESRDEGRQNGEESFGIAPGAGSTSYVR